MVIIGDSKVHSNVNKGFRISAQSHSLAHTFEISMHTSLCTNRNIHTVLLIGARIRNIHADILSCAQIGIFAQFCSLAYTFGISKQAYSLAHIFGISMHTSLRTNRNIRAVLLLGAHIRNIQAGLFFGAHILNR